jgi:hypothetical protein
MYHDPVVPCIRPHIPDDDFYIECVIVCHKFTDFLCHTLPHNKAFFNRLIVVTSPEDKDTQKLCEFYHVECVVTSHLQAAQNKFCKGAGINEGLARLSKKGWVVHMDADIWLPPQFRRLLAHANLDKAMIYGIDRFSVIGADRWQAFLAAPKLQHECDAYIHLHNSGFALSTRVMQHHMGGYVPIGFFQLWHPVSSDIFTYPEGHTDAGREDLLFANYWPRPLRGFIPEIIGYHLESEAARMGINWNGRKTKLFSTQTSKSWYTQLYQWLRTRLFRS